MTWSRQARRYISVPRPCTHGNSARHCTSPGRITWTRFVTMQNHYNLLYREEEREMIPLCMEQGIGVMPWSPLARGRLTRPWATETPRTQTDAYGNALYIHSVESDRRVVERVAAVAAARGLPPAQIALAWLGQKPGVSTPIIGASKPRTPRRRRGLPDTGPDRHRDRPTGSALRTARGRRARLRMRGVS